MMYNFAYIAEKIPELKQKGYEDYALMCMCYIAGRDKFKLDMPALLFLDAVFTTIADNLLMGKT